MGGELHRNNIRNDLSGFFDSGSTQGTVTGGSFTYTEPELRRIIQNWRDLAPNVTDISKTGLPSSRPGI